MTNLSAADRGEAGDAPPARLHVVLYQPEIAANVGAVGRTCVAAGAMLWLIRPLGFLIDDRRIKRAGLDYWEHLRYRVVDSLDEVAEAIGHDRFWSFSTRASTPYTQARYQPGDALVYGPESRGLPARLVEDRPDRAVRIPIRGEARSLNLSVSVAVGVFEAVRQFDAEG
ncbi:tRNA (cytidine(34)-2'-O)-methyltransferase [Tautonia marina]|uniref:tRNA (cytidine(34)-2'-O)-methyltransferase n=1 Tax=Tautonia marina TaxID=2653855 RepID=UPI0012610289|nr:tRNA (cytidine(34)-2'-O)-methyltransferase [Tautonia marina]